MGMFCFQCQETAKGVGCQIKGVCGKTEDLAHMMDLLVYTCKGISVWSTEAKKNGIETPELDRFIITGLFTTITNANFDKKAIIDYVKKGLEWKRKIKILLTEKGIKIDEKSLPEAALWDSTSESEFEPKALTIGVLSTPNEDVRSLRELVVYGVKGMAAYAEHALNLGFEDKEIYTFIQKALADTLNDNLSAEELVALVMENR